MVGNNLPTEGKIYCEQLDKQVCEINKSDTDGQIYNPANHGAGIYRTTQAVDPKNAQPLREKINKYVKLKAFQAAICLKVFLVLFLFFYFGSSRMNRHHYIIHQIFMWAFLFLSVCSAIAAVLLYLGNKNENKMLLKAFLCVGSLSYSRYEYTTGGFDMVRRRIVEIVPKDSENPAIAPSSYPNPVPVVYKLAGFYYLLM